MMTGELFEICDQGAEREIVRQCYPSFRHPSLPKTVTLKCQEIWKERSKGIEVSVFWDKCAVLLS